MRLRTRLDQLAKRVPARRPHRRLVWIESAHGPAISHPPGGGLWLKVPVSRANRRDPEAALTDEQRALIRTDDRRFVVRCSTWEPEPGDVERRIPEGQEYHR